MRRLLLILIVGLVGVFAVSAQDSDFVADDPPYPCPYTNGAFYQPNVFPRYDINSKSLVLVDAATNQTVRVLDTFDENIRIINWSPDCRYLSGAVGRIRVGVEAGWIPSGHYIDWEYGRSIVFWDSLNGGRLNAIHNEGRFLDSVHVSPVIWSPQGTHALVLSGCPSVHHSCVYEREPYDNLWIVEANKVVAINKGPRHPTNYVGADFNQFYWDMNHNYLWSSGSRGVSVFDITTGERIRLYRNGGWTDSRFVFSSDGSKVVVYTISMEGSAGSGALTVHDIDGLNAIQVNVEGFAAPEIPLASYHSVALSADNRYLVVGHEALRVWDVQNLPENVADRLPIYRHGGPQALIQSVRFADWGVIETSSAEGVQHWDLHTGEFIPG